MPIRKLQLLELKILLELNRICDKHKIQYFLMGGTLLGAVRHNGFIPWDDDIDIGMMRSEYVKFLEVCKYELSEDYFLQTFESDESYLFAFAKIRLNGTEYSEPINKDVLHHNGIYIDIFPFDHAPDNHYLRKLHRLMLLEMDTMCWMKYGYVKKPTTLKLKALSTLRLKTHRYLSRFFSKSQLIRMRENLLQKYNKKQTKYCINASFFHYPSEIFDQFIELEFEGIKFPAPAGYTTYLECAYGDYMRLPPEHERIRHTPYLPDFGRYIGINSVDDILKQRSI